MLYNYGDYTCHGCDCYCNAHQPSSLPSLFVHIDEFCTLAEKVKCLFCASDSDIALLCMCMEGWLFCPSFS